MKRKPDSFSQDGAPSKARMAGEGGKRDEPRPLHRHGAGRIAAYLIACVVLNALLAVFLLYVVGVTLEYDWSRLQGGETQAIVEAVLHVLLLLTPLVLTQLLNRWMYRAFRGHGRFPHGMGFITFVFVIAVQALVIFLVLRYGMLLGAESISFESFAGILEG